MNTITKILFTVCVTVSCFGYGQSVDSLVTLDYSELFKIYNDYKKSNLQKAKSYAMAILEKTKQEEDPNKIANGYRLVASFYYSSKNYEQYLPYVDSAIIYGKQSNYKYYPSVLYVNKGMLYYRQGKFDIALDNFLEGLEWSEKRKDPDFKAIIQHNIGTLKMMIGKYEEAKQLFRKSLRHEGSKNWKTENDTLSYLSTLSELVDSYRKKREINSAIVLNNKGIKMSKGKTIQDLFRLHEGVINYYQKDYIPAISNIKKAINAFHQPQNKYFSEKYNLIDAYLHLGKCYEALSDQQKALENYKKIDSISQSSNYLISESRVAYKEIIDYYLAKNDKKNQLYYLNRLIYLDSISDKNLGKLNNKIFKEYDTSVLFKQKENIIASLEQQNSKISTQNIIILVLLGLSLVGIAYYYYRQRLYKTRFTKLLEETTTQDQKEEIVTATTNSSGITKETFDHLIDQLQQFEDQKGYLKSNLNAKDLAKSFGSNSSYLSKVINTFKEKSFSAYINDLRIEYVIDKLKTDSIFRKYTIKAIAQDIGFNNAEAFSKAFYKKTGIYPSYFIKELEKQCL